MSLVLSTSGAATKLLVVAVSEGGGEIDTEGVGDRQSTEVGRGRLLVSREVGRSLFLSRTSETVRDGVGTGELF